MQCILFFYTLFIIIYSKTSSVYLCETCSLHLFLLFSFFSLSEVFLSLYVCTVNVNATRLCILSEAPKSRCSLCNDHKGFLFCSIQFCSAHKPTWVPESILLDKQVLFLQRQVNYNIILLCVICTGRLSKMRRCVQS